MYFPRLEDLRVDHDKTQIQIAEYLNLNREVYRRYEKGLREIPVWALVKLAELYHTSTDYLLGRTDNPSPAPCVSWPGLPLPVRRRCSWRSMCCRRGRWFRWGRCAPWRRWPG